MKLSKRWQNQDSQVIAHPSVVTTSFESALEAFLKAQDAVGKPRLSKYMGFLLWVICSWVLLFLSDLI